VCYDKGWGVAQDHAKAVRLFRLAADQGHSGAYLDMKNTFFYVGNMFEFGKGVAQDRAEAIQWYRLAAAQGNPFAQTSLATLGA
jgi:uncharacterized protein